MDVPPLLSKPHFRRAAITLLVLCFASQLVSAAAAAVRDSPSAQHGRKLSSTGKAKLPAVAIIGAGIGGASTAYFLNKMLGGRVIIHVYEMGDVGGRLKTLKFGNESYELGGSMVYQDNMYIRGLAEEMGLDIASPESLPHAVDQPLSLFDGNEFVFNQSAWTVLTMLRMGMRYGTAPLRFRTLPLAMFQRFLQIYDLQANGTAFDTPQELLRRVGLLALTQESFASCLKEQLGSDSSSELFGSEFAAAVNRVNYNQGSHINALVGMVSMLPAVDNRVFKVVGGNSHLPARLLSAARAHVKRGWVVDSVRPASNNRFELHATRTNAPRRQHHKKGHRGLQTQVGDEREGVEQKEGGNGSVNDDAGAAVEGSNPWDQEVAGPYHAVVIAAPLEHSHIKFHGLSLAPHPKRRYQRVVTTFVVGQLRASYFGVETLPTDQVLVTEYADTPFSVISPLRRLDDGRTLYKLFSPEPIMHLLRDIFGHHEVVAEQDWNAYPKFSPPEKFAPFKLAPGIFYNNALENAASAMEMSAIAARNSALLVKKHLFGQPGALEQPLSEPSTQDIFDNSAAASAA